MAIKEGMAQQYTLDDDRDDITTGDNNNDTAGDFEIPSSATADEAIGFRAIMASLSKSEIESMPDKNMPLRYFRAHKGDVPGALNGMRNTLEWRKAFQVDELLQSIQGENGNSEFAEQLRKEAATCKLYVRGYDSEGRALLYMRPSDENTQNETGNLRNLVYHLEKAIACSNRKGNMDKVGIVIDYKGYSLRNAPPMSTSRKTLDILQNHYPERLHKAYICNPPFVFRTFWAFIKPFIDPVTKQKILFCVGKAGMAQIAKDVGPENAKKLEKCAGGKGKVRPCVATEYMNLPFNVAFDE